MRGLRQRVRVGVKMEGRAGGEGGSKTGEGGKTEERGR